MGFAVRVRSAGQKYGPTCHQRDRADVTDVFTLVRLSSLGQHVGVLALAGYKRRKSALTAGPIAVQPGTHSLLGWESAYTGEVPSSMTASHRSNRDLHPDLALDPKWRTVATTPCMYIESLCYYSDIGTLKVVTAGQLKTRPYYNLLNAVPSAKQKSVFLPVRWWWSLVTRSSGGFRGASPVRLAAPRRKKINARTRWHMH